MNPSEQKNLIKSIARECFLPHGIVQKDDSRTFLKDHGLFSITVEFQVSDWSNGAYFNVGVDFHFFHQENLAFSYAHRESDSQDFSNEQEYSAVFVMWHLNVWLRWKLSSKTRKKQ